MQFLHNVIKSSRKRNESQVFKYLMAAVMNSVVIILKNGDFAISKRRREDCIQFSFLIAQANESLLTVKEKTINNFLNERTGTRP